MSKMNEHRSAFKIRFAIISLLFVAPMSVAAQAPQGQITREDARSLVIATLQARGYDINSPKLEVEEETDPYFPSFFHFSVYFARPERLATIGSFAVAPKTADVWDTGLCARVRTRNVRRLQKTLRLRYQLGTAQGGAQPCQKRLT
jgi:hypothetical protein